MGGGAKEARMGPDGTGVDGDAPDDVCTVTATEPCVAAPMVKPLTVTVKAALDAPMVDPDVERTTAELDAAPHTMLRPRTLLAPAETTGNTEGKKKFDGYESVMEPPGGIAAVMVKVRTTETLDLKAMRSDDAIAMSTKRKQIPAGPIKNSGQTQAMGARNVWPL